MELAGLITESSLVVNKANLQRELGDAVVGENDMSTAPGGPGITVVLGDYESDDMSLIDRAIEIEKKWKESKDIEYGTARGDDAPNAITLRIGSTIDKELLDALIDINA